MIKLLLLFPIFFTIFILPVKSTAQIEDKYLYFFNDSLNSTDSNFKILNFSGAEFYHFSGTPMYVFNYKHEAMEFADTTSSALPIDFDKIDFKKNTLVLFSYHGGDCHAKFSFRLDQNDEEKIFTIIVLDIYGGCRAGGHFFTNWALIPKLPDDYKAEFRLIRD